MSKIATTLFALAFASATSAMAAQASGDGKPQTTRMSQCSTDAKQKGLKGEARKEYMSQCLRSPASRAAAKECSDSAAEQGLKGAKRKDFVKDCVKSKTAGNVG